MASKITIEFERDIVGAQYRIHATVKPLPDTDPVDLQNCLLVRLGSSSQPEQLARVATLAELDAYSDAVPALIKFETGSSLTGVIPTDLLIITPVPALWTELGTPSPFNAVITSVGSDFVLVTGITPFPAYAEGLTFIIVAGGGSPVRTTGTDGKATRVFPTTQQYFRTDEYHALYDDLSSASNALEALRAQAQGLVADDENFGDVFGGTSTEVFE